jgi:hypothetical protein
VNIQRNFVTGCFSGIVIFSSVAALGQEPGVRKIVGPDQSIENKASLATPEDPDSIRALADEVFNFPRSFPRMSSLMEGMVKDRLVQAETLYRQAKMPGIHEQALVKTFNDLSERLGGPPHLRTTLSQVRIVRMGLALSEPKFMGPGIARENAAIGESISPIMGPFQAAHLMATLIDQKFLNPDFQVSPQEWEETSLPKVTEEIQATQTLLAEMRANPPGRPVFILKGRGSYSSEKRRELEEWRFSRISSFTAKDGLDLINHALATLGID